MTESKLWWAKRSWTVGKTLIF